MSQRSAAGSDSQTSHYGPSVGAGGHGHGGGGHFASTSRPADLGRSRGMNLPAHLLSWQLLAALLLNGFIQCVLIGAYAARLAGALSGRVATSISLFNLFVTVSRMASFFYTPILGSLSDRAALAVGTLRPPAVTAFEWQLRSIVFAGTVGAALGTVLLPTFLMLFLRGIATFERTRSVPKALLRLLLPRTGFAIARTIAKLPSASSLRRLSPRHVPKDLLFFNVVVTGVYAIGVIAAAYASVLDPTAARTALLSSGLINGIAMISYTLIVDPGSAIITDEAVRGQRPVDDVKALVVYLSLTTLAGMLLSQLVLTPAALVIAFGAHLLAGR
ncbi:DUF2837 family protein [bacterium]|nr:MAG: DUF2837 family protein [bacterium]